MCVKCLSLVLISFSRPLFLHSTTLHNTALDYNIIQCILFTLKSDKSDSSCILMNFILLVAIVLSWFLCIFAFYQHGIVSLSSTYTTSHDYMVASATVTPYQTIENYVKCSLAQIHSSPCRSIDSLQNDLFLVIMYGTVHFYMWHCTFLLPVFVYGDHDWHWIQIV